MATLALKFGSDLNDSRLARRSRRSFSSSSASRRGERSSCATRSSVGSRFSRVVSIASIETTRENLLPTLDLVAQELRSPRLDADELEKLRRERLASLESFKSDPNFKASVAIGRKLTPVPRGHVLYSSDADELTQDINAVSLDSVRAFHRNFYGASYADFAAIGDFDPTAVKAAVTRL